MKRGEHAGDEDGAGEKVGEGDSSVGLLCLIDFAGVFLGAIDSLGTSGAISTCGTSDLLGAHCAPVLADTVSASGASIAEAFGAILVLTCTSAEANANSGFAPTVSLECKEAVPDMLGLSPVLLC